MIMTREEKEEALKWFKDRKKMNLDDKCQQAENMAIKALEQEQKWIPVSERLPEDNELVLFSTKTDRVFEGRFFSDNTNRQWYSFCDRTFAWNNVVIAWMPLPEPYKAESEVQNDNER